MAKISDVKTQLHNLLNASNDKTLMRDKDLSVAIQTLIDGYFAYQMIESSAVFLRKVLDTSNSYIESVRYDSKNMYISSSIVNADITPIGVLGSSAYPFKKPSDKKYIHLSVDNIGSNKVCGYGCYGLTFDDSKRWRVDGIYTDTTFNMRLSEICGDYLLLFAQFEQDIPVGYSPLNHIDVYFW